MMNSFMEIYITISKFIIKLSRVDLEFFYPESKLISLLNAFEMISRELNMFKQIRFCEYTEDSSNSLFKLFYARDVISEYLRGTRSTNFVEVCQDVSISLAGQCVHITLVIKLPIFWVLWNNLNELHFNWTRIELELE